MKSGLLTTEFYLSLGNIVAGILVMTGILVPERLNETGELIAQAVGGIVALGTVLGYLLARTELKKTTVIGSTPKVEG